MQEKLTAMCLTIFLANDALAQKAITPSDCIQNNLECACLTPPNLKKVSQLIIDQEFCRIELSQYKNLSREQTEAAWYTDTTFVVGGVIVGVSLAGVLGYWIGSHKK